MFVVATATFQLLYALIVLGRDRPIAPRSPWQNGHTEISMDGKGSWRDNVFVERLWRSVKYEEVYLKAYDTVSEARASIGCYFSFYNTRRPHSSLERQTPDQAYFNWLPQIAAA